jgi:sialate O-acetylesterase
MNKLFLITALTSSALFGASALQAVNTVAAGAWTTGSNWDSGTFPDGTIYGNGINSAVIKHAMTIAASEDLQCYTLDLRDSNSSLTIDPSGSLYVEWDATLGGSDFNSTSSNLIFSGSRNVVILGAEMTWTHDGTDDFDGLDIWQRGNNNSNLTLAGTGLLSLDILKIGLGAGSTYQVTVDRDLTVNAITEHNTAAIDTLNLLSGTTTTDALYALGTTSKVNFASTTAALKVLSSNLSVETAQAAIALDYIIKSVSGANANSIQATADGIYTVIATSDDPPSERPALYLEAPVVDNTSITTHDATVSALLTSPDSSLADADITLVWSAAGDQGTSLAAWGTNSAALGNFATGADATVNFADSLDRNLTYSFRIYASKDAAEAWSDASTLTTLATDFALPSVLGDNMLLQRNKPIRIWGQGDNGGTVTVDFNSQSKQATVANGEWMVTLEAEATNSVGLSMTISHDELVLTQATLTNILVGEVWRAAGQSNMEWGVASTKHGTETINEAENTNIRLFLAPKDINAYPQFDYLSAVSWKVANSSSRPVFSGVAYHFARDLQASLSVSEGIDVPVGIILTKDGGTRTQCWTPLDTLTGTPGFELDAARALNEQATITATAFNQLPDPYEKPFSFYYNGMVHPTRHYTIRGAIWYQGERNSFDTDECLAYRRHFPLMIEAWRTAFEEPDLPFYFVQLPRMGEGASARNLPPTRESQLLTERDLPNTGMVVSMDVIDFAVDGQQNAYPSPLDGADYGLHTNFKMPLGLRFSAMAQNEVYGASFPYSAPRVSDVSVVNSKIVITFDHVTGGLISRDGDPLRHFTICDTAPASPADTATFVAADAVIVGTNTVEVSATGVTNPIAVRYAWRNDADLNLYWTADAATYDHNSYDTANDDPAEYGPNDPERSVWTEFFGISPFRNDAFEIAKNTRDRDFVTDGNTSYWVVNEDPADTNTCYAVIADSTANAPQARTVSLDEGTETGVWHVYDKVAGGITTLGAIGSNKAALDITIPQGGERVLRLVRAGDVEDYSDFATDINWGSADATESGDPEGDGRSNRFEYAFGSDPLSAADEPALMGQVVQLDENQYLQLSYFENVLASDLTYSCLQTDDLTQSWTLLVPAPEDKTVTPVDGSAYQEIIIRTQISYDAKFLKVEAL